MDEDPKNEGEDSEDSGDDEEDDSGNKQIEPEKDYENIFWLKEDNAYAHSSGMRYKLKNQSYTPWVTDDPDHFRCLHFYHFRVFSSW